LFFFLINLDDIQHTGLTD